MRYHTEPYSSVISLARFADPDHVRIREYHTNSVGYRSHTKFNIWKNSKNPDTGFWSYIHSHSTLNYSRIRIKFGSVNKSIPRFDSFSNGSVPTDRVWILFYLSKPWNRCRDMDPYSFAPLLHSSRIRIKFGSANTSPTQNFNFIGTDLCVPIGIDLQFARNSESGSVVPDLY